MFCLSLTEYERCSVFIECTDTGPPVYTSLSLSFTLSQHSPQLICGVIFMFVAFFSYSFFFYFFELVSSVGPVERWPLDHRYTYTRLDTVIFIQCGLIWFHAKLVYLPVTQDANNVYSVKSVYPSPCLDLTLRVKGSIPSVCAASFILGKDDLPLFLHSTQV